MSLPIIGLTTYGSNETGEFHLPSVYVDSVRRSGGIPILLPPGEKNIAAIISRVQGIVLTGGGDIDPALYHGTDHEAVYGVNKIRDQSEIKLASMIFKYKIPTLAICRGLQIINVALGGNLIENLPDISDKTVLHRLNSIELVEHPVIIKEKTRLAGIMQKTLITVTSRHHQAIRELASALEIVAQATDGTIEAVESRQHPGLIAIQWHPELTSAEDPMQQRLFDALVTSLS